ncbi:iron chaperone [Salinibacterium hongtaonis]|nr:DUF1801 domain-containing protein [Salinibacterium hongtaonis]
MTDAKKTDAGSSDGFTADERAAMKERAAELREEKKRSKAADKKERDAQDVVDAIAAMPDADRALAERLHALIVAAAPSLDPKLWYGMPAYALNGKIVCFVQPAEKFKTRYTTLGFNEDAQLDDGTMWPTAYAITAMTAANEKRISDLVSQAVAARAQAQ